MQCRRSNLMATSTAAGTYSFGSLTIGDNRAVQFLKSLRSIGLRFSEPSSVRRMTTSLIRLSGPARSVLSQLRHHPMTVEELARSLHLTSNAVRNQLSKLLEANFVAHSGSRPGVSKPARLYSITLEGQVQFSTLYLPVLTEFLEVAEGQCSGKQLVSFMRDTGRSLATRYPKPSGNLKTRVNAAARLLKSFGGLMAVDTRDGAVVLRSSGCPLAALTSDNSAACRVIEGLVAEYVGASVVTCCDLRTEPRCCFEIQA